MTPTPERALELADYLWSRLYAPAMITEEAIAQINEVLRAYAEIAPKWQAVLGRQSKPVHSCDIPGCMSCDNPPDTEFERLCDLQDADDDLQSWMDRDRE